MGSEESGFREALDLAGLGQWSDEIEALDRESVRLHSEELPDRGDSTIGASKLGGDPDLPPTIAWPDWHGKALSFIAQIALSEMPRLSDQHLPADGLLSFFYEAERQDVWGFDPADRGAWRVLWSSGDDLRRRMTPEAVPGDARYHSRRLQGTVEIKHVPWESAELDALGMTRDELFSYAEILEEDEEDEAPIHRLLGHPEPIQGDMQLESQLVSNGLYCGDSSGYHDPRAIDLGRGATNWRLLLQIDSDQVAEMMWGDVGRLYFWMTEDAIERRDWDSAWMILQCG